MNRRTFLTSLGLGWLASVSPVVIGALMAKAKSQSLAQAPTDPLQPVVFYVELQMLKLLRKNGFLPFTILENHTMQRIWVFSELYYPEQTSTGYILTRIAEGLAEEFDVSVITGPPTNFFKPENALNYEERNKVKIFRCQGTNFDKDILSGRIINLITRSAAIFWKGFFNCQKGETILVVTNPPLLPFVALVLKWLKGCNFVLLIHDVYPEILVATGLSKPSSLMVKFGQIINRLLYKQASKIITLGRDMTKLVKAKLDGEYEKIYCIPNWADIESIHPTDRQNNTLLQNLGLTDKFVVLYAGNIGRTHGIEELAQTAEFLANKNNNKVYFIVIGFGAKKKWLTKYVENKRLETIKVFNFFPITEQNIVLNAGDVALISFVSNMAGVSVPSRMYNQMAAGKPIIAVADDWSELAEVIKEENIGWVVKPGDIEEVIKTIEFAAQHPELCAEMGARAANIAQTKYTFTQTNQAYQQLFREILTAHKNYTFSP
jgi:glycosyltransferase involved in cell wall biosynthesis